MPKYGITTSPQFFSVACCSGELIILQTSKFLESLKNTENNRSIKHLEHYSARNPYAGANMTLCENQYRIYIFFAKVFKCASISNIILKSIAVFIVKSGPWRFLYNPNWRTHFSSVADSP